MWVTWGQARWQGSARLFEDYGTRNLPEVLTLGDALDFQAGLGVDAKLTRYRELWDRFLDTTDRTERVIWRSPRDWERSASLFALEIRGISSADVFDRLYREGGFVFRPFQTQNLNTIRISPNVYNSEEEIDRFFAGVERLPRN
jgi:selenocysteine lyase/cysteine desulfurase